MQRNAVYHQRMAFWLGFNTAPDYGRALLAKGLY